MEKVQIFVLVAGLLILFGVVELVRRGRLRESYSVLWICTSVVIIFFAVFRHLIDYFSQVVGIYYSPSAFFLLAFMFLIPITVQFSVIISKLSDRNKILTQELAILKLRLDEISPETGGK